MHGSMNIKFIRIMFIPLFFTVLKASVTFFHLKISDSPPPPRLPADSSPVYLQPRRVTSCFTFLRHLSLYSAVSTKHDAYISKLTLRLLMSYIYIYIYIYMERTFLMFLDHTQRRTTVGRTPLDE